MIVTGQTWTSEVPHEPGQSMTFRMLSHVELSEAALARRKAALEEVRGMIDLLDKLPASKVDQGDPEKYDRRTLLRQGVVSWSYPQDVDTDLLDPVTADWAVAEILRHHGERSLEERKNG